MATSFSGSPAGPATNGASASGPTPSLSDQARASVLWTFIRAQAPRFAPDEALEVVRALGVDQRDDIRQLATRIRDALRPRGIALKLVNSQQVAAQLLGQRSWHTSRNSAAPLLKFHVFEGSFHIR